MHAVREQVSNWIDRALYAVVLAGSLCIPLAVLPHAFDAYRLPKELALRAEAIVIAGLVCVALILRTRIHGWRFDRWISIPVIAFGWMLVATMASTNRGVSLSHLAAGAASLVVYIATLAVARAPRDYLVAVPIAVAMANALLVIVEELGLWMPFGVNPGVSHHLQCTALIGNPNEVGSFLAVAAVVAVAGAASNARLRAPYAIAAVVLVAGVVASRTLTAIVAFAIAAFAMLLLMSWRRAIVAGVIAIAFASILIWTIPPMHRRALNLADWLRAGDYNALLTERVTPFLAAAGMWRDHPITGVGPGAFSWNYYDYKLGVERSHPELRRAFNRGVNFGEVHDDFLQVLAEAGLPALLLFVAAAAILANLSFAKTRTSDPREAFAGRLALPLAVVWLVLSIAQFPLESTAVRMLIFHFAALCVARRTP